MAKKWYSYFVVTDDTAGLHDPSAADAVSTRVSDIVPGTGGDTAFTAPVTTAVDLGEVYEAAQIAAPAHGYTVLKVAEMLQSEHISALPADVKRKSVLVALDAAGVKVTDIVEDAVRRDRALDTYERVLQTSLEDLKTAVTAENARLEDEIAKRVGELRARIDENRGKVDSEQQGFLAWQTQKRREEQTIADAVSYFVSENPVTTAAPTAKDKGDVNVR